jgi:lipoyl(octanoyl) transferase
MAAVSEIPGMPEMPGMPPRPLAVRRLGLISYADALTLQRELVEERRAGRMPDTLLLLEHPHVITLGVKARGTLTNVIVPRETLEARGVELFDTGRGGDVTYHGPGQLVGYPIIDLRPDRCDVHRYVRDLEEVLIRVAADLGVHAARVPGLSGAWVTPEEPQRPESPEKLAAIGVRISRWITSHGFALNVNTDLSYFDLIVPCGIADKGVTSVQRLRDGTPASMAEVMTHTARRFAEVFERHLDPLDPLAPLNSTDTAQLASAAASVAAGARP